MLVETFKNVQIADKNVYYMTVIQLTNDWLKTG